MPLAHVWRDGAFTCLRVGRRLPLPTFFCARCGTARLMFARDPAAWWARERQWIERFGVDAPEPMCADCQGHAAIDARWGPKKEGGSFEEDPPASD